jgi:hypothetical protein
VRLDNTAPTLVSSAPADGSVSTSASSIVLTASEPVNVVGVLLDGGPAPAPAIAGNQLTFSTGSLADGLHVLFGWLEDASGTRTPFRVAVTVESSPLPDRPPVEMSMGRSSTTAVVAAGSLATVTVAPPAWPAGAAPEDFLVVNVDPAPTPLSLGAGLQPSSPVIDVTAHWALAGLRVSEFDDAIEVLIPGSGAGVVPVTSENGTSWRVLARIDGTTLPAGARDGYYVDGAGVHILTRHLTLFALGSDVDAPSPPTHVAGEMRADGLTIRWIPGRDNSGQLGNVILSVNGEPYREFGPTEYEAKLGELLEHDSRRFSLVQLDAAGNASAPSDTLRALPKFLGLGLEEARSALTSRGIAVGSVVFRDAPGAVPGTVVGPENLIFAIEGGSVTLVVARDAAAPQTRLAFSVAAAKRHTVKTASIAVRLNVTKPATVSATLRNAKKTRLQAWTVETKAGANVVKLRLPRTAKRPGSYTITLVARAGAETVSRTVRFTLVAPKPVRRTAKAEVVLTGETAGGRLRPGRNGVPKRIVSVSTADQAFDLIAAGDRDRTVVVLDADAYGSRIVGDLRIVFPSARVIAISGEPATRALALRAGAVRALPRTVPPSRLAKVVAAAAAS